MYLVPITFCEACWRNINCTFLLQLNADYRTDDAISRDLPRVFYRMPPTYHLRHKHVSKKDGVLALPATFELLILVESNRLISDKRRSINRPLFNRYIGATAFLLVFSARSVQSRWKDMSMSVYISRVVRLRRALSSVLRVV